MSAYYDLNRGHDCGFFKVEGWVVPALLPVLQFAATSLLAPRGPQGGCLEIGVHHGRFFLFLEQLTPDDQPCVAVDVFGLQHFNPDRSGCGNLGEFRRNVQTYARNPSRVTPLEMDSTDLLLTESRTRLPVTSFSLISVDGCHTAKHTCLDLVTAGQLLAPGGICILDDVGNLSWMDVLTGTVDYLRMPSSNLAPFACGYNKLLMTTLGFQKIYFDYFRNNEASIPGLKDFPWPKLTTFCGYEVFRYGL
jgi:hypothetical protein